MTLPRLAPSKSKKEFYQSLGLSEGIDAHKQLYEAMKAEASAGRRRLGQDPMNLVPQCRDNPNVQPPYSWDDIMESAKHQEVMRIYHTASPFTKAYYDRGRFRDGPNEDNWIIRWCLWHVFRYRDNRNRNRGGGLSPAPAGSPSSTGESPPPRATGGGDGTATGLPQSSTPQISTPVNRPYDPVRDL